MRRTRRKNIDPSGREQRRAAVQGVAFHILVRLAGAGVLLWACGLVREIRWLAAGMFLLAAAGLITIPFSLIALKQRLRELEKGELNEARKY